MGFCTIIDYRRWRNFAKYAYMGSLITVFLVLSPIGIENHGAKRWVGVGPLQFQPAEVVKIGVNRRLHICFLNVALMLLEM